jgi:hypothetical protein
MYKLILETGNYMNDLNHVCFSYWTEQKKTVISVVFRK